MYIASSTNIYIDNNNTWVFLLRIELVGLFFGNVHSLLLSPSN